MGNILQQEEYIADIKNYAQDALLPWEKLSGKSVLVTGATGMIGSSLIDVLMMRNRLFDDQISIIALSRNEQRAKERFAAYRSEPCFSYVAHDITMPLIEDIRADFIIHAASNTHPKLYSTDPVGTIATNVDGAKHLLELAVSGKSERFVFVSSVEIYGENRGDVEKFSEAYLGYLDCNTLRAGYPEAKRIGETICNAYGKAYGLDFVIPRLSRVYGPTLLDADTKALSQFIHKAVQKEDIVLKSAGNQEYSYTYVLDAVSGVLAVMLLGERGQAYNIADAASDITLKGLTELLADIAGTKVVFELPDAVEAAGYSTATKALLDAAKLEGLGWKAKIHIREGLEKTVRMI